MWILGWAKCLISKLHRQHLKAFRNTLPSCVICISHWPHTSPRFNELKWIIDLCCIWTWVALFLLLFLYPCFSSKCLLFKKYSTWWLCHYRPHHITCLCTDCHWLAWRLLYLQALMLKGYSKVDGIGSMSTSAVLITLFPGVMKCLFSFRGA